MKRFFAETPSSLEDILRRFGCEKPFLKNRQLDYIENDGTRHYRSLTASGNDAYNLLTDVIYGLQNIDVIDNADEIIEQLDDIVSEGCIVLEEC